MNEHTHDAHNCNDSSCENHYAFMGVDPAQPGADHSVEMKFTPVEQAVADAISKAVGEIQGRSFSGRNPELGKMIKCQVCGRRHREVQNLYTHSEQDGIKKATKFVVRITCAQQFKELHVEEDLATGEKTLIYAMAAQNTKNGIIGSRAFKGKRLKPHLNRKKLLFVERVRQLFGEGTFDPNSEEYKKALGIARKTAGRQLRKEARQEAKTYRHQQDVSRRINRGFAAPGSR